MKTMFQSYFSFTKKELNGILILCILNALILIFPWIYTHFREPEVHHFDDFDQEVKAFLASAKKNEANQFTHVRNEIEDAELKPSYFYFDPNKLSETAWLKLGLTRRQIKVIKNYESKGGRFYKKIDLQKMYSISPRKFLELEPYIVIAAAKKTLREKDQTIGKTNPPKANKSTSWPAILVELNSADSAQLETIRGIGPVFASRIIRYKNRLGGFHKKEQLLDVYGLDSAKYETLKDQVAVDGSNIQRINVNKASFEDFKRHPYLTFKQMNAIIQYRKQHGAYNSFEDLKKIEVLNEEILRKIEPYLIYK